APYYPGRAGVNRGILPSAPLNAQHCDTLILQLAEDLGVGVFAYQLLYIPSSYVDLHRPARCWGGIHLRGVDDFRHVGVR
ncbi:hypothetical protein N8R04_24805, partial [Enterobacter hormaechei subsp. xiangfangensis]|nr:hypothetical protein [Enterobacter hormaechei subsp. xiangfangensis]